MAGSDGIFNAKGQADLGSSRLTLDPEGLSEKQKAYLTAREEDPLGTQNDWFIATREANPRSFATAAHYTSWLGSGSDNQRFREENTKLNEKKALLQQEEILTTLKHDPAVSLDDTLKRMRLDSYSLSQFKKNETFAAALDALLKERITAKAIPTAPAAGIARDEETKATGDAKSRWNVRMNFREYPSPASTRLDPEPSPQAPGWAGRSGRKPEERGKEPAVMPRAAPHAAVPEPDSVAQEPASLGYNMGSDPVYLYKGEKGWKFKEELAARQGHFGAAAEAAGVNEKTVIAWAGNPEIREQINEVARNAGNTAQSLYDFGMELTRLDIERRKAAGKSPVHRAS